MIILDTNVLSESLKPEPSPGVLLWLRVQARGNVFITAITHAEVLYGVEMLPPGRRKTGLLSAVEKVFAQEFDGRILPFDADAARVFPRVVGKRKIAGRPISEFDAMIASIARAQGAVLATRNTRDFQHCGIELVNPWVE